MIDSKRAGDYALRKAHRIVFLWLPLGPADGLRRRVLQPRAASWAYDRGVTLRLSESEMPTQNAYIEPFRMDERAMSLRHELLD